jgi:hypothetical protein
MQYHYVLLLLTLTWGKLGIDISALFTVDDYKCIINAGHGDFLAVRGYRSYGAVDPNLMDNLGNAWAAGFNYVDIYMFPCLKCGNPEDQADTMLSELHDARYNIIWVDIEIYQWSADINVNRDFIKRMVTELKLRNQIVGIYSDATSWKTIVGDWTELGDVMLWYAHWNGVPSFSDFVSFGGWAKPAMKQYRGDQKICEMDVDFDFY